MKVTTEDQKIQGNGVPNTVNNVAKLLTNLSLNKNAASPTYTALHRMYVLLKERNMLMTMKHACNEAYELFPSPERIDKVQESMKNIETVVRERNEAYYQLETGETGEQPTKYVWNILDQSSISYPSILVPNGNRHLFGYGGHAVSKFQKLYSEKLWNEKRRAQNREKNDVISLLKKF